VAKEKGKKGMLIGGVHPQVSKIWGQPSSILVQSSSIKGFKGTIAKGW